MDNFYRISGIVIGLIIAVTIAYGTYKHFELSDKEFELTAKQQERDVVNDSIRISNAISEQIREQLKTEIDSIININNELTTKIQSYANNNRKRNEQIKSNPVVVNRSNNDNYLLNYKPKYK